MTAKLINVGLKFEEGFTGSILQLLLLIPVVLNRQPSLVAFGDLTGDESGERSFRRVDGVTDR